MNPPTYLRQPAHEVYANDYIFREILNHVSGGGGLMPTMMTSKRAFEMVMPSLYKEVPDNLLEALGRSGYDFDRISRYLQAVQTVALSQNNRYWPDSVPIPTLQRQYPNLKSVNFYLPGSNTPSSITLYPSSTDGNKPTMRVTSPGMAVYGTRPRFSLVGLRLGAGFGVEGCLRPGEKWTNPLVCLVPVEVADRVGDLRYLQQRVWGKLFLYLESLSIANGCDIKQLVALVESAPKLEHLAFCSRGRTFAVPRKKRIGTGAYVTDPVQEFSEDDSGGGEKLDRLEIKLEDKIEDMITCTIGINGGYHRKITSLKRGIPALHLACSWNLDEVRAFEASRQTVQQWIGSLKGIPLPSACESLSISVKAKALQENAFLAGVALSALLPDKLKVDIHCADAKKETLKSWKKHLRSGRLHGIQLGLAGLGSKPGFRHKPVREQHHRCITPDSDGNETDDYCCIETERPLARVQAEKTWEGLSLGRKMKVLKKCGVKLIEVESEHEEEEEEEDDSDFE